MQKPRRCIRIALMIAGLVVSTQRLSAQAARSTPPSTPSAPHERLTMFEGVWGRTDSATGLVTRDTCAWLPEGRRHMVCRRRTESPRGASEQMIIYSYRAADSTYTSTVLLPGGQVWRYEGRPEGDGSRWVFNLIRDRPNPAQRLRQVISLEGDALHFIEEVSVNGGPWSLSDASEDYRLTRVRPPRDRAGV